MAGGPLSGSPPSEPPSGSPPSEPASADSGAAKLTSPELISDVVLELLSEVADCESGEPSAVGPTVGPVGRSASPSAMSKLKFRSDAALAEESQPIDR